MFRSPSASRNLASCCLLEPGHLAEPGQWEAEALAAWPLLRRSDPEAQAPLWPLWLLAGVSAAGWVLSVLGGGDILGQTLWACLLSIPALALPIALALFRGLRHRVETRPARSGLLAGLFSGGAAAAVYAVHCDEDSAAFFLLWYGMAIVLCGLVGRMAGRRWLGV